MRPPVGRKPVRLLSIPSVDGLVRRLTRWVRARKGTPEPAYQRSCRSKPFPTTWPRVERRGNLGPKQWYVKAVALNRRTFFSRSAFPLHNDASAGQHWRLANKACIVDLPDEKIRHVGARDGPRAPVARIDQDAVRPRARPVCQDGRANDGPVQTAPAY